MGIYELFNQVKSFENTHRFKASEIPGIKDVFLGSDEVGRPCIFIKSIEKYARPNLKTERLALNINQEYLLTFLGGSIKQEKYHALCCLSENIEDIDTFLTLVDAFLTRNNNGKVNVDDIVSFFHSLIRLFSVKPDEDQRSRRQGLWGELFLMKHIRGYKFWAPYWYTDTSRLFDFSSSNKRIEVKTTISADRIHLVSHKQVFSQGSDDIFLASIMLREDDTGISLKNLINVCRESLKETPYYFKIENAIRHANMQNPSEEGPKYNINEAIRTLRFFDTHNVPRFESYEPEGVTGTHYRIDLTNSTAIDGTILSIWLDELNTS